MRKVSFDSRNFPHILCGPRIVLEVAQIRIALLLTACLTALGPTAACGNPDAEAWESLISNGEQVENELEELDAERSSFYSSNPGWTFRQCAGPISNPLDFESIDFSFDLLDLSWELHQWREYAEALAEAGTGRDARFISSGHLAEIKVDLWDKRQAFDKGLGTIDLFGCPVNPWK